jgi:predicted CopG family antitoxin
MPKTITISDEVYEKLVRLKGNKSFNEIINELNQFYNENRKGRREVLDKIFGVLSKEEAEEIEKIIEQSRHNFRPRILDDNTNSSEKDK